MSCPSRHTKFQPDDDQWACPKCGSSDFYVESDDECSLVHTGDLCRCPSCGYEDSGSAAMSLLARRPAVGVRKAADVLQKENAELRKLLKAASAHVEAISAGRAGSHEDKRLLSRINAALKETWRSPGIRSDGVDE